MKVTPKRIYRYPTSLERDYAKELVAYTRQLMRTVRNYIPEIVELIEREGVHLDDVSSVDVLLDRIRLSFSTLPAMQPYLQRKFNQLNQYNDREFNAIIKSVLGASIADRASTNFERQMQLDKLKTIWVNENLSLIKSIEQETLDKVRNAINRKIVNTVSKARLTKELTDEIQHLTGVTRSRAILIATDQVGKLNGRLMQHRQRGAGIEEYVWSSSKDQRVRPRHREYEGKTYSWDNPPSDGHPGKPIRCRCVALPVIDFNQFKTEPIAGSYTDVSNNSNEVKFDLQLFAKNTDKIPTVRLDKAEYAQVMSELNTHMSKEDRSKKLVTKAIGNYLYIFENHGFDDYRIIRRVAIDGDGE